MRRTALAFSVAVAAAVSACSSATDVPPSSLLAPAQTTQFAAAPGPITNALPSTEQLTVLYAAAGDYSIREEDRVRLFEGPSESNRQLAQAWGAQPSPQRVEFTVVETIGPNAVQATGQGRFHDLDPYPVGPIPFVRANNEWKIPRAFACDWLKALEQDVCG